MDAPYACRHWWKSQSNSDKQCPSQGWFLVCGIVLQGDILIPLRDIHCLSNNTTICFNNTSIVYTFILHELFACQVLHDYVHFDAANWPPIILDTKNGQCFWPRVLSQKRNILFLTEKCNLYTHNGSKTDTLNNKDGL